MSIKEQWAEAILASRKRWEFRRRCNLEPGMRVRLYATAPRAEIIGYFTVGVVRPIDAKNPDREIADAGLSTPAALRDYLQGLKRGFAIETVAPHRMTRPVRLEAGERGPQSYRFLHPYGRDKALLARLSKASARLIYGSRAADQRPSE